MDNGFSHLSLFAFFGPNINRLKGTREGSYRYQIGGTRAYQWVKANKGATGEDGEKVANSLNFFGGPNGVRTRVTDVRVGEKALFRQF